VSHRARWLMHRAQPPQWFVKMMATNSLRQLYRTTVWVAVFLLLAGCQHAVTPMAVPPDTPAPSALPATATATVTVTPTATQTTATATPLDVGTSLPTPTLPFLSGATFSMDEMVFGGETDACSLPCWWGIRIGETRVQDVLNGSVPASDFIDRPYRQRKNAELADLTGTEEGDLPGLALVSKSWPVEEADRLIGGVYLNIGYEEASGAIQFIDLWSSLPGTLTPVEVLDRLGPPQTMLVKVSTRGSFRRGIAELWLIYENGLWFRFYNGDIEIEPLTPGDQDTPPQGLAHLCFDNESSDILRDFILLPPQGESSTPGLDIGKMILQAHAEYSPLVPADDLLGMSLEEIAATVLRRGAFCFDVRIET
jgi:hypothetical protein